MSVVELAAAPWKLACRLDASDSEAGMSEAADARDEDSASEAAEGANEG